jgi:ABC-type uncharacterized transport system.
MDNQGQKNASSAAYIPGGAHKKRSFLKNPKFKYGAVATGLTVAFIALIIVINVIFSALSSSYMWYADMTKEQLYNITEASAVLLDPYRDKEGFSIKIIFCEEPDELDASLESKLVHNMALQFAKEYDYITVDYIDIIKYPALADPYKTTTETTVKTTDVIIENGSDFRKYSLEAFYTFDEDSGDVFALNAEYKITAAILQMAGDRPIAYFTIGHGETVDGTTIYQMFQDAGFDTRQIDLSKEDMDSSAKVVVVNNPRTDFMGFKDSVNEIAKIDGLLDNYGNLMVFVDATVRELPELEEFLSEWGIGFQRSLIRDYSNSLSIDGTELVAEYTTEGLGSSLTKTLWALETPPKAIVNYARPITLLYDSKDSRDTSVVLQTSSAKTAVAIDFDAPATDTGTPGVYNLLVISRETRMVDNEAMYNYVMVGGTESFTDDKYIGSATYGNGDIIYSAMKAFGKETVPFDIDFKVFEDKALDITTEEANIWSGILTVFLPVCALALGCVVYLRRRHL